MARRIQDGKLLYHITAIENLETIFKYGLLSRTDAANENLLKVDIADSEIIGNYLFYIDVNSSFSKARI